MLQTKTNNDKTKRNTRYFFNASLVISLLFHLLVLNSFIFVFPLIKQSHKPKFIFLGSFLKDTDISNISFNKPPTQTQRASNEFAYRKTISTNTPYEKPQLKPVLKHSLLNQTKQYDKTTFKIPEKKNKPISTKQEDPDNTYEEYVPLKYFLK